MRKVLGAILLPLLAVAALVVGSLLSSLSFAKLKEMRELERVPQTAVAAVLPGEVNLFATVDFLDERTQLRSPDTRTQCVYYRYHVERRETDSEGKSRWSTVRDERQYVPFRLGDDTGAIVVQPHGDVRFRVPSSNSRRSGDMRYTEYRIDPGHELFCFGYAVRDAGGPLEVRFDVDGRYTPILSRNGEHGERVGMATASVFACWGGVAFLSFAVLFVGMAFKVHRIIVHLSLVSIVLGGGLVYYGLAMMHEDLTAAHDRLTHHRAQAAAEVTSALQTAAVSWTGDWDVLGAFDEAPYGALGTGERERLQRIRIDLWRAVERTNEIRGRFPERLFAPGWGVPVEETVPLPAADVELAASLDQRHVPASISDGIAWGVGVPMVLLGLVLTRFGFRRIKHKRYSEHLPTSPTTGAAWGPTELAGTVALDDGEEPLKGPLSSADCVQYHYVVKERRGSGKNAKWVTIQNTREQKTFYCVDEHGRMAIDPVGAEILTRHSSSRSGGRRSYSETRLELGDKLYALGYVKAHPPDFDELEMRKNDDSALRDFPYLLSNYSEQEVVLRLARRGFLILNFALCAVVLFALLMFAAAGSFAASDYLTAALIAPGYLLFLLGLLMFNDLVFLRNRVDATRSNIDVALKKRYDLLPNLEAVVKRYMAHERDLLARIAEARTQAAGAGMNQAPLGGLMVVGEKYPDLKADRSAGHLMQSLIQIENEIAFMRSGYNQSVERYNSRIQHIPEVVLAKLFRFRPAPLFQAEYEVHDVPSVAGVPSDAPAAALPAESGEPTA